MKKAVLSLLLAGMVTLTACAADEEFTYSSGIEENGFWSGVTATDYVELPDYKAIEIPADVHEVSQESLDAQMESLLAYFTEQVQITDQPVADGDTVNIDYVGTIDGVAFENGDTGGLGTDVTIGVTSYIDDFLEQIIGRTPGETFDIHVTFPEEYGVEELNGKDAVFTTTVNYIVEDMVPEATDAFVVENLQETYGWSTVEEMEAGLYSQLQEASISLFIQDYIVNSTTITETPEDMITYQADAMIQYYTEYAANSDMELEAFLSAYLGVESQEELLETYAADNKATADYYLVLQAIAEDAQIQVDDQDISDYFIEYMDMEDYSELETYYGMPFITMSVLQQKVLDYLIDNAQLV